MTFTYSFVKTWQALVNVIGTHYATETQTAQEMLFFIKQFLTGALGFKDRDGNAVAVPGGLWTVDNSCDSVTASNWASGTDLITSYDKLVFGASGAARSNFVLKSPASFGGNGYPLYLEVACILTSSQPYAVVTIGKTPNANGSTTVPPTMTDAKTSTGYRIAGSAAVPRLNGWLATDGTFLIAEGLQGLGYIRLGLFLDPIATTDRLAGDLFPWIGGFSTIASGVFTSSALFAAGNALCLRPNGAATTGTEFEIPAVLGSMSATGDMVDNKLPRIPAYVITSDGAPNCSLRGRVDDAKFCPVAATGETLPNAGPAEIVALGTRWSPPLPNEVPVF